MLRTKYQRVSSSQRNRQQRDALTHDVAREMDWHGASVAKHHVRPEQRIGGLHGIDQRYSPEVTHRIPASDNDTERHDFGFAVAEREHAIDDEKTRLVDSWRPANHHGFSDVESEAVKVRDATKCDTESLSRRVAWGRNCFKFVRLWFRLARRGSFC